MAQGGDKFFLSRFDVDRHYSEFSSWWEQAPPPLSSLPRHGFVIGDNKCMGFIGSVDCDFAICMWWHCNPSNSHRESHEAIKRYVMACQMQAKSLGKRFLFLYTSKRAVIRILESLNFVQIDHGHMACEVL